MRNIIKNGHRVIVIPLPFAMPEQMPRPRHASNTDCMDHIKQLRRSPKLKASSTGLSTAVYEIFELGAGCIEDLSYGDSSQPQSSYSAGMNADVNYVVKSSDNGEQDLDKKSSHCMRLSERWHQESIKGRRQGRGHGRGGHRCADDYMPDILMHTHHDTGITDHRGRKRKFSFPNESSIEIPIIGSISSANTSRASLSTLSPGDELHDFSNHNDFCANGFLGYYLRVSMLVVF